MKKIYVYLLFHFMFLSISFAQTFTSAGANIPDHGAPLQVLISVSALDSSSLTSNYGLETVCININHTADRDLAVYLMSPTGMTVELTSGNGGFSDNYTNTCFNMSASQLITAGTPPYTGSFVPEHSIGSFNNGQAGNGVWRLIVTDYVVGDTGSVINVSLIFGYTPSPPLSVSVGPCDDYSPSGCACPGGDSSCWLVPDILTATSMLQDTFWQRESFNILKVTNSCANIGFGPMEIIGTGIWMCNDSIVGGPGLCPDGQYAKQQVKQRIYIKEAGVGFFDFKDTLVGTMQFHSDLGHNHLHVDDWAVNTLRLRGPESDASKWPIIGTGNKVSFCIYDHLICGSTFENCEYEGDMNVYSSLVNNGLGTGFSSCGNTVQGLSVGYSDVYDWSLDGQEITFDSICNGNYYLVSEFDPSHRFVDLDRSNNVSVVPVKLKNQLVNCCKSAFRIDTLNYDENIYQFVDMTMPIPDRWHWDFGDGRTDTNQFPIIDFNDSVSLTISLFTNNNSGCSDSTSKNILVHRDFSDTCRNTFTFSMVEYGFTTHLLILGDTSIIDSIYIVMDDTCGRYYVWNSGLVSLNSDGCAMGHGWITNDSIHITLFYKNSCIYTFDTVYNVLQSINNIDKNNYNFSIAPNPAKNETAFSYELSNTGTVSISLIDATGKLIENIIENNKQLAGKHQYKINIPTAGFYILKTKIDQTEHIDKIFSY